MNTACSWVACKGPITTGADLRPELLLRAARPYKDFIQDLGPVLAFVTAHAAHLLWHYFAKLRQFVIVVVVVALNIFVSHQNIDNYM